LKAGYARRLTLRVNEASQKIVLTGAGFLRPDQKRKVEDLMVLYLGKDITDELIQELDGKLEKLDEEFQLEDDNMPLPEGTWAMRNRTTGLVRPPVVIRKLAPGESVSAPTAEDLGEALAETLVKKKTPIRWESVISERDGDDFFDDVFADPIPIIGEAPGFNETPESPFLEIMDFRARAEEARERIRQLREQERKERDRQRQLAIDLTSLFEVIRRCAVEIQLQNPDRPIRGIISSALAKVSETWGFRTAGGEPVPAGGTPAEAKTEGNPTMVLRRFDWE